MYLCVALSVLLGLGPPKPPLVHYSLRVDSADLSQFTVEMRLRHAPDTSRLAMAAHPEYDDRFWRFVEDLRVESPASRAVVTREDSAVWRVTAAGGDVVVRYRIHLPAPERPPRAAWRPFLTPTGGLVGGPHAFMYVMGQTSIASLVTLSLPRGWEIATGLEPAADPSTYRASSVEDLIDSPILVGRLRSWRFTAAGVPHRVVYWPLPDATPFDTTALVDGLRRLAEQAITLFGRAPYRDFTFLLQDGAGGSLEHHNSVAVGAPSAALARDMTEFFGETAHEFFHTWNLMAIRPVEYRGVDYRAPAPSSSLWFSEGLTMYYADLLLRRAGLPRFDSTRTGHLEGLVARYVFNPAYTRFSPEQVSRVTYNAAPGALGDYNASVHLQGELLGALLDVVIRDATAGRRSMDDVMRVMLQRFSGEEGFTGPDIEKTVAEVCGCDVKGFFDDYVRGVHSIAFDRYLALAGMRAEVTWALAQRDGRPDPDLRVWAWAPPDSGPPSLLISNPASVWGCAGLHAGDRIALLNGAVAGLDSVRTLFRRLRIGDTVRFVVSGPAGRRDVVVVVAGYDRPTVRIEDLPGAGERQILDA